MGTLELLKHENLASIYRFIWSKNNWVWERKKSHVLTQSALDWRLDNTRGF